MLLSILFNYFSGLDIARNLTDRRLAKRSLIFNIVVNIAILGFFKYEGFVLDSLNAVLPVHITYHPLALPIGISFYTFQILSYIIDVYRGNVKVQKNILNFAGILKLQSVRIMYQENLYNTFKKAAAFFFIFFQKRMSSDMSAYFYPDIDSQL